MVRRSRRRVIRVGRDERGLASVGILLAVVFTMIVAVIVINLLNARSRFSIIGVAEDSIRKWATF